MNNLRPFWSASLVHRFSVLDNETSRAKLGGSSNEQYGFTSH